MAVYSHMATMGFKGLNLRCVARSSIQQWSYSSWIKSLLKIFYFTRTQLHTRPKNNSQSCLYDCLFSVLSLFLIRLLSCIFAA